MNKVFGLTRIFQPDNDALAAHRHSIIQHMCFLGAVLLLCIMAVHLVNGAWRPLALNGLAWSLMTFNAVRMRRGGRPPMPFVLLAAMLVAVVLTSVYLQGVPGVLWSFPLLFICYFALSRRMATALGVVLMLGVSALAWPKLGPGLAARVLVSQVFVMLMVNIVLNLIGDLQLALQAQAITDPLTGAYNRRHLQAKLEELVATPDHALLALDVDHFKRINDEHGHDIGDEVLCRLVHVMNGATAENTTLYRTGGEEFMLLLPAAGLQRALQQAETLRQQIATGRLLGSAPITVSIGVAVLLPGQDTRQWLKRADTALYRAKHAGRDRVVAA